MGARYIVFDKDNTLSIPFKDSVETSLVSKMASLQDATCASGKFASRMAILSNSAGSCDDDGFKLAKATERGLSMPVIRHLYKKPDCLGEVLSHFAPLSAGAGAVRPEEICMVGDRVLTDIMFGNMNGMITVLVAPLSIRRDHIVAVIIRFFERNALLPLARTHYTLLRVLRLA